MHVQVETVVLLHRVVREGLSEKMTFEQMLRRHEGTSFEDMGEKQFQKMDSKGKGPKTRACLSCSSQ